MIGLAMLLLAVIVVRRALAPLDRLAARLSARDPQDLTPLDAAVPREIDGMVKAMNGFMGRLDRQVATMNSLISDTAHQLRIPVAALRAQADLAAGEGDRARQAQLVARIHKGTVRLSRLLDQMLSRALVIHRGDAARRAPVDLRDIALEIFEAGEHQAVTPGAEVRLEIGDAPVMVMADALSLGEAERNLLGNALTHGQSPVTVGADSDTGEARLWVEDAGPGPGSDIRTRLGERFAPGGEAGTSGSGLGLSIAQAVAAGYGGRLVMENRAGGFRIAIVLRPAGPA